jgi:hypothetical protein
LRDRLALAVLEDFERVARKAGDQMPVAIDDGGRDADEIDAALKASRRILSGEDQVARGDAEEGAESVANGTILLLYRLPLRCSVVDIWLSSVFSGCATQN